MSTSDISIRVRRLDSAIEKLGDRIVEALDGYTKEIRDRSFPLKPESFAQVHDMLAEDRVALAELLCQGTSSKVSPR